MTYIDGINAEALDKFLAALESGKYQQGAHRLHTISNGSMCCLGVATAELGPECGVSELGGIYDLGQPNSVFYAESDGDKYYLLMPPIITNFLGIPSDYVDSTSSGDTILVDSEEGDDREQDGFYRNGKDLMPVSALNDKGVSFSTIARRIRETLTVKEN